MYRIISSFLGNQTFQDSYYNNLGYNVNNLT